MTLWRVNNGTQVARGDNLLAAGETFEAPDAEIVADGLAPYVTEVPEEPVKAQVAPTKAKTVPTKAKPSSPNKTK